MTQETITMSQKELSRYEIIKRLIKKEINGTEAAKQLSLSLRQVKRIKAGVSKEGAKGIIHKNRNRESNRRISKETIEIMEKIVKQKYRDFGPTFASEKLEENHQIKIGKETLRQLMINWELRKPKPRKENKECRAWRPRKEYYGQMQQFDGSYSDWFEDRAPECCLLSSIDDAAGKITKLKFVDWEGVIPSFIFWKEYLQNRGKPISIYLDRHSTYKQNQKSCFDDPISLTQFQRAMEQDLGVKIIHAHSPQAKGRVERLFGTLQDRLVKELRLAGISTKEEANRFAEKVFIPRFNQKFSVPAQKKKNLHCPLNKFEKENLDKTFSIQNIRIINNDFTIKFRGRWFQLSETQPCLVLRKNKVQVEERVSGEIFISLRNRYLNFKELPCRPEKVKMKVIALSSTKPSWKPPANHPWRKPFLISKTKVNQPVSVS